MPLRLNVSYSRSENIDDRVSFVSYLAFEPR